VVVSLDTALRFALIAAVVFLLAGIVSAVLIHKVVGKVISLALCALVALVFWSQRVNIQDCADNARLGPANCRFLWFDVTVPSPLAD
jgi:hypothetical protein